MNDARADLLAAAEAAPAELMREMSRAAMKMAMTTIAANARALAADPNTRQTRGDDALRAFADAMDMTSVCVWGGSA